MSHYYELSLKKQIKAGTFTGLESLENEFKSMLKEVLQETAQEELTSHLGYEKNQISVNSNSRNGYNKKKLNSKYGQVNLDIPRDRDSSFEPQLIKKRETILEGTEDLIISLYAKGMSVRDIQLHLDDLYGYELSTETISNMTNKVLELAKDWQNRALDQMYPIESLNSTIKRKTKSKGSFPTIDSAFKVMYLSTQEVQNKWKRSRVRNWSEIYPQLCIFFSEIMEKYTK